MTANIQRQEHLARAQSQNANNSSYTAQYIAKKISAFALALFASLISVAALPMPFSAALSLVFFTSAILYTPGRTTTVASSTSDPTSFVIVDNPAPWRWNPFYIFRSSPQDGRSFWGRWGLLRGGSQPSSNAPVGTGQATPVSGLHRTACNHPPATTSHSTIGSRTTVSSPLSRTANPQTQNRQQPIPRSPNPGQHAPVGDPRR